MKNIFCVLLSLLLSIGFFSCSSKTGKNYEKSGGLATQPKNEDSFQVTMSKSKANLDVVIASMNVFRKDAFEKATANLLTLTSHMRKTTDYSQIGSHIEWEALCEEQKNDIITLQQQFANQEYEAAANTLGQLLATCIKCHKPYRIKR